MEQVLEDDEVELVIISTPNLSHFDYAKRCLQAGKHGQSITPFLWLSRSSLILTADMDPCCHPTVLIEKPLTPTLAEAQELVDLAREKNLVLAPFQNRRWDADFLAVQGLLKENKVCAIYNAIKLARKDRPV